VALVGVLAGCGHDDPAPGRAASPDVAKFLAGWAEAVGSDIDATTGYPKRVKRVKDGMVMVLIPAGTFQMGAVPGDVDAKDDEKPRHSVTLSKAYYMDEHEVSNEQFEAFATATGHKTTPESAGQWRISDEKEIDRETSGASWRAPLPDGKQPSEWRRHPVVLVSWDDAKTFASWAGAALPTEAQFERALRGGEDGRKYPWGEVLPPPKNSGNFADVTLALPRSGWKFETYDDGFAHTAPVGSFAPNAYGLYDISGNVWEWCADFYDDHYYASSSKIDPLGPASGTKRILRGTSWGDYVLSLRASDRGGDSPTDANEVIGFRCAKTLP